MIGTSSRSSMMTARSCLGATHRRMTMSLYLHLRDKVFRVKDQAALPVPLDPELLWLAQQAKSQNIVQDIYRLQMERNRSRYESTTFDERIADADADWEEHK